MFIESISDSLALRDLFCIITNIFNETLGNPIYFIF